MESYVSYVNNLPSNKVIKINKLKCSSFAILIRVVPEIEITIFKIIFKQVDNANIVNKSLF